MAEKITLAAFVIWYKALQAQEWAEKITLAAFIAKCHREQ